jgi:predicted HicB family RNase H-like nuclease
VARTGRPPKRAKERQSHLIALRLKPAEYRALEQAAKKASLSVSEYIRQTLKLRGEK